MAAEGQLQPPQLQPPLQPPPPQPQPPPQPLQLIVMDMM